MRILHKCGYLSVILLTVLLTVGLFGCGAEDRQIDGLLYTYENGGWTVSPAADFSATTLTVPAELDGEPVLLITGFEGCTQLTHVDIATAAGSFTLTAGAFPSGSLQSFKLSGQEITVEEGAFASYGNLKSVSFSYTELTVEENAFANCTALESVSFGSGELTVEADAFVGCEAVHELRIPGGKATFENDSLGDIWDITRMELGAAEVEMATASGFADLAIELLVLNGTTFSYTNTDNFANIYEIQVSGNVTWSVEHPFDHSAERLVLTDGFTFSDSTLTNHTHSGFLGLTSHYTPMAAEIYVPRSVTAIPDAFFGEQGSCKVYYAGSAEEWAQIAIGQKNNQVYTEGDFTLVEQRYVEYTVTWHLYGEEYLPATRLSHGGKITPPVAPTRELYRFKGWSTDPAGGTLFDFENTVPNADLTLYAVWEQTGDGDAAELTVLDEGVLWDEEAGAYYAVIEWVEAVSLEGLFSCSEGASYSVTYAADNTPCDLSNVALADGMTELTIRVTSHSGRVETTHRFVIYTVRLCTVRLVLNNGRADVVDDAIYVGAVLELDNIESTLTKPNHTFVGWHLNGVPWDADTEAVPGDIVLEAQWRRDSYVVTYDYGDGSTQTQTVAVGEIPTMPTLSDRNDAVFAGWMLASGEAYDFDRALDEDVTLRAAWSAFIPISSYEDLAQLEGSDGIFRLVKDINCYNEVLSPIESFSGVLDGNGHKIYAFSLDNSVKNIALILTNDGTVKDLTLSNAAMQYTAKGDYGDVGMLVGVNNGLIESCTVTKSTFSVTKNGNYYHIYTGLISVQNNGTVRDCTVSDCTVSLSFQNKPSFNAYSGNDSDDFSGYYYFGGMAGKNTGTVTGCLVSDVVLDVQMPTGWRDDNSGLRSGDESFVGLLVGDHCGTVSKSTVFATVTAGMGASDRIDPHLFLGGAIARCCAGSVTEQVAAYVDMTVRTRSASGGSATLYMGGLIGEVWGGSVKNCYAAGQLTREADAADSSYVGGFAGVNQGAICNSYSLVAVNALDNDTRLVGFVSKNTSTGTIISCYTDCMVTATAIASGNIFAYSNAGTISNCHFVTREEGENYESNLLSEKVNGVELPTVITDPNAAKVRFETAVSAAFLADTLFWDPAVWEINGTENPTFADMGDFEIVYAYSPRKDFGTVTASGTRFTAGETVTVTATPADGYRFVGWYAGDTLLSSELSYTETVTSTRFLRAVFFPETYTISTYEELTLLKNHPQANFSFVLGAHIDCEGQALISVPAFYGTLDGAGYTISNFVLTGDSGNVAFLGENHGTVKNLTLSGAVSSDGRNDRKVALLSAVNYGTIVSCNAVGKLRVVGNVISYDEDRNTYVTMGGLVAENRGTLKNCKVYTDSESLGCELDLTLKLDDELHYNGIQTVAQLFFNGGIIAGVNYGTIEGCDNGNLTFGTTDQPLLLTNNCLSCWANRENGKTVLEYTFGGIVGYNAADAVVKGCTDGAAIVLRELSGTDLDREICDGLGTAKVYTKGSVGGIAGNNEGTVTLCRSAGLIAYDSDNRDYGGNLAYLYLRTDFGGISGKNSGTVEKSVYNGIMVARCAGESYAGAVVGYNAGEVLQCYGNGHIAAGSWNDTTIEGFSFWSGANVTYRDGSVGVGGVVGRNTDSGSISNCLADCDYTEIVYDELKALLADSTAESLLLNAIQLPRFALQALFNLFDEEAGTIKSQVTFGTVVGSGEDNHRGTILQCYYVDRGTDYTYTDGAAINAEGETGVTEESLENKLFWSTDVWDILDGRPHLKLPKTE